MKKQSEKTLKRKLDQIFSQWIRQSAADSSGYVTCYCSARIPWKESDASHYISRGNLACRYQIKNVHPSCRRCNRYMGGNLAAYALFLEEKYGRGILQELHIEKSTITKNFPYQQLIDSYTEKLKLL